MTRLVAFGCSFTFGHWLLDNKDSLTKPSKFAWPQLLADKLNIECINLGKPGSSNKETWYHIINFEFNEDDIVMILWTNPSRYCIIKDRYPRFILGIGGWKNEAESKAFYKHLYNPYDMQIDFYLRCNHINQFLKNKVRLVTHNKIKHDNPFNPSFNEIDFLKTDMEPIREELPKALDNYHPGIEAHKQFANEVYNEIKNDLC